MEQRSSSHWGRLIAAIVLTSVVVLLPARVNAKCGEYGSNCYDDNPFLPAAPGKTPKCAKGGDTYCEKIEKYPTDLIRYLLEKWGYDYVSLLASETRDEFMPPVREPTYNYNQLPQSYYYHPPPQTPHYGPYNHSTYQPHYNPPRHQPVDYHHQNGGQPHHAYPTRFDTPSYYYTAVVPTKYTPSDSWWTRFRRSSNRTRRQAASQTQLCPTTSQFVMPKAAMSNGGNWMYVVNLSEVNQRYTQLVKAERCISDQCNGVCSLPSGFTSSCQQKFVQKRLVALEGSGERLYNDVFWFPHCCTCEIAQNNG